MKEIEKERVTGQRWRYKWKIRSLGALLLALSLLNGLSGCCCPSIAWTTGEVESSPAADESLSNIEKLKNSITWLSTERSEEFVGDLINGKLCVGRADRPEYDDKNLNSLDWNMQVGTLPTTFQLNLQGLQPVLFLSCAYDRTNNEKYMDLATDFIRSWRTFEANKEISENNAFVWDHHGMAMRTDNLVYYAIAGIEHGYFDEEGIAEIVELIEFHADKLCDENCYYKNHNHGVMQDRALILAAYFLNNDKSAEMVSLAKERLQEQWDFEFTDEMISTENSFNYQIYNKDLYSHIISFLLAYDDDWGKNKLEELKISENIEGLMIKPNLVSSGHGETSVTVYSETTGSNGSILEYVTSKGTQGVKPKDTSFIFPEAGYYIARETWDADGFEDSSWAMFKSGFLSVVHKQDDDNSFQYYAKGHDIFVDPGFYGYVSNSLRRYLTSAAGHNAISIDRKTYYAKKNEPGKGGIVSYSLSENEPWDYVLGINNYFEDADLIRHFINFKEAILLVDECVSQNSHKYTQNFQCGPDMKIISAMDNEVLMQIADTDYFVRIKQLRNNTSSEVLKGEAGTPYGQYSPKTGQVDYIYSIRFSETAETTKFVTLITIEDENGRNIDIAQFNWNDDEKAFWYMDNKNNEQMIKLREN